VFSRGTVERIDAWYDLLPNTFILDRIPAPLLARGPYDLPWWQWIALLLTFAGAFVFGQLFGWLARKFLEQAAKKTATATDDAIAKRIGPPIVAGWTLLFLSLARGWIGLRPAIDQVFDGIVRVGFLAVLFWFLLRALTLAGELLARSTWLGHYPSARGLIPFAARIGKALVFVIGVIAILSELNYPVESLIAGLGIGGLAMALAGQKTVENLFGAFSIGVDQPFREGDVVRIEDQVGVVERVGLRSTRVRTADRTTLSWPNGKLADMRLESLSSRDRSRFSSRLRLALDTGGDRLRRIIAEVREMMRTTPEVLADQISVQLVDLRESWFEVEVTAVYATTDGAKFNRIREEVILGIVSILERQGVSFALPTQAIYVKGPAPAPQPFDSRRAGGPS
jgi:MscS family membrane protein